MQDIRNKLKALRKLTTGFDAAHGYDLRKPLTRARIRTIDKYFDKLGELTGGPHQMFAIPKDQKNEAFQYTGQKGFPRFNRIIVHKTDASAEYEASFDKLRPRGSRFFLTDRRTGQRHFHIPASAFLSWGHIPSEDFVRWLEDVKGETVEELEEVSFYEYVLEYYGGDSEFFLIKAGESYMWGSGGPLRNTAKKIQEIINNYDERMFASNSPHNYRSWFKGVVGFTDRYDIYPRIGKALKARREFKQKYKLFSKSYPGAKEVRMRIMRDGAIGVYVDGVLVDRHYPNG